MARVLVTGASGFIGSHLTRALVAEGHDVTVVVTYLSLIENVRLAPVWDDLRLVEADLRNRDALAQLNQPFDWVYHLAAYNHVGDSFTQVTEALSSNLLGTANLLESLPEYGRFVYTSSSEIYGLQDAVPFDEAAPTRPLSPYAVGKLAGELYSHMKRSQNGQPIVCLRPFNTFGPYQSEKAVIPELILRCLRGLPVRTTEGKQTREFNYVEDVVRAFRLAAEVPPFEGVVNVGCGREIAIRDLATLVHRLCESRSELRIGDLPYRPTEIWRMSAANQRAREVLGWEPQVSFEEGLRRTIAWFRDYQRVFVDAAGPLRGL